MGTVIAAACCAFSSAFAARPTYSAEQFVRIASAVVQHVQPYDPNILGGTPYRMYFSSSGYFIMSATSSDGLTWSIENGFRLSTAPLSAVDCSSITAFGMLYDSSVTPSYLAYYVGISSGVYSILKATSTDGLTWGKTSNFSIQFNSGSGYVDTPRLYKQSSTKLYMFYTRSASGAANNSDSKLYRMISTDGGKTFGSETQLLSGATAYHVAVSTLTDGRVRLYYTAPLSGGTTSATILSAIGINSNAGFNVESGSIISTTPATSAYYGLAVVRSTDTYTWRLYDSIGANISTNSYTYSAWAGSPVISSLSPAKIYSPAAPVSFTVSGEIFTNTLTSLTLANSAYTIPITSYSVGTDMSVTFTANPVGATLGDYSLTLVNSDGTTASLSKALNIDFLPGGVSLVDNLFRPLKGGKCTINVIVYNNGSLTLKVYTANGALVKTIYDGSVSSGTSTYTWAGDTDSGAKVASGVYLIHSSGPKLNAVGKVIVIK